MVISFPIAFKFQSIIRVVAIMGLCFIFSIGITQEQKIDSLNSLVETTEIDSIRLDAYLQLATLTSNLSIGESKNYALKAKELALVVKDKSALIKSLHKISFCLDAEGKLDSSLLLCEEALRSASEISDSTLMTHSHYLLGVTLSSLDRKDESSSHFYKSIEIAEALKDEKKLINAYNGLGTLLIGSRDEEKAIELYRKALNLARAPQYKTYLVRQLVNLSVAIDDLDEKEALLDEAHEVAIADNNQRALSFIYNIYSYLYEARGDVDKALSILLKAYDNAKQLGSLEKMKVITLDLGKLYLEKGMLDSAEYRLNQYLETTDVSSYQHGTISALKHLSKVHYKQGKFSSAYNNLDSAFTLATDQYDRNVKDKLAEANAKYETEKKDAELARQEIQLLTNENQKRNLIGGSIVGMLLLGFVFYGYYSKQKLKKKEAEIALQEKEKEASALREIDQMKTQFFTNISHELRTPLTLIKGPLANVLEKDDLNDNKKAIQLAYNNADRLLEMINEIMDLSKLKSGNIELKSSEIQLKPFIKRVFFAFQSMAELRNINMVLDDKMENITVNLDGDKFEKILNNLISNGIKYAPNGSNLTLNVSENNNQLLVKVIDQGSGIHENDLDKIFDRFYQSSVNKSIEEGGTGVGLALSKELAVLFGGDLNVKNNIDNGCTFSLKLPINIVESNMLQKEIETATSDELNLYKPILIHGEKPHLLIIEDNEEMQQYIGSILDDDYRCSFAHDGFQAIQKLQTNKYDLISSDIMMPQMDGFQLKEKVNELGRFSNVPFIFLSARALNEDIIKGLRLGVDDYITKPFNKHEYKARIYNLLKNRKERETNKEEGSLLEVNENIDETMLKNAEMSILKNISNPDYKVMDLANDLNYSQRHLNRLIKNLTGLTPVNLILEIRLQRSYQLLKSKSFQSVSEVMYEVGIESASYFARKFKERFGLSPVEV